jgi:hypothetical protein
LHESHKFEMRSQRRQCHLVEENRDLRRRLITPKWPTSEAA